MRRAARRDDNENEIVLFLRECGAYVKPVNHAGLFDLLVFYNGHTLLFEIKDGAIIDTLTNDTANENSLVFNIIEDENEYFKVEIGFRF